MSTLQPNSTVSFKLEFSKSDGTTHLTPEVIIEITDCKFNSTSILADQRDEMHLILKKGDQKNNIIEFQQFSCSYAPCCNNLTTGASSEPFPPYASLDSISTYPTSDLTLSVRIDTKKTQSLLFYLFQKNIFGSFARTNLFKVEVVENDIRKALDEA